MSQHGSGFAKSHVRTLAGRCERWFAFTHRSIGSSLVNWLVISSHSKHVITRPVQQKPPASITSWVKIPSCQPRIHRPLLFFRIDGTPPIRDHLRLKCHQPMQISQRGESKSGLDTTRYYTQNFELPCHFQPLQVDSPSVAASLTQWLPGLSPMDGLEYPQPKIHRFFLHELGGFPVNFSSKSGTQEQWVLTINNVGIWLINDGWLMNMGQKIDGNEPSKIFPTRSKRVLHVFHLSNFLPYSSIFSISVSNMFSSKFSESSNRMCI